MRKIFCAVLIGSFVFTLSAFNTLAATIHIPADQPTIQAGIDAAVDGDIVLVAPGTYVENIDFLGKAITVQSESGPNATVIDGGHVTSVVTFTNGETESSLLEGFMIRNGSGTLDDSDDSIVRGGGIYCYASSPSIDNCTISGNSADNHGGGFACRESSAPTITNCTISGNIADYAGGGIACEEYSSLTITGCTISENSAMNSSGGGICCVQYSSLTVTNCTISENTSDGIGGGIRCAGESSMTVTNCTVSQNNTGSGGGIHCWQSFSTITDSTISDNIADRSGGGICFDQVYDPAPTIESCTIIGNSASEYGGGYIAKVPIRS